MCNNTTFPFPRVPHLTPNPELAAELKTVTDTMYSKEMPFFEKDPQTMYLDEDFTDNRALLDAFAKVLEKMYAAKVK